MLVWALVCCLFQTWGDNCGIFGRHLVQTVTFRSISVDLQ